jgi:6-pyruvoyl-tetrahydropterin synthase
MRLELVVNLNLEASHSLEERESPHSHRWDIQLGLLGDLNEGRVVSLTRAHEILGAKLRPLQNTFLNDNKYLNESCRVNPTCENLALFLLDLFQKELKTLESPKPVSVSFIQVGLWEENGQLGSAKITL